MRSGLKNLGNTCFMNSALQCLVHSPELLKELLTLPVIEKKNEYPVTYTILKFIAKMSEVQETVVNPSEIKSLVLKHFPYIMDGSQHDSHEFFLLLLQIIEEEQNKALGGKSGCFPTDVALLPSSYDYIFSDPDLIQIIVNRANEWWKIYKEHNPNLLTNVFYGEQVSSIRCMNCNHQSCVLSAFNSLYLSIPKKQYEITVNVVVESMVQNDSYNNPICHEVYPIRCIVDNNSLVDELEEYILTRIVCQDQKVTGSLIFLQGKYEKTARSILYNYVNKNTPLYAFSNLPPKSTLIAYFVPYKISRQDYHSFVLVNQVSLLYLEKKDIFHMNNACIPFCFVIQPNETTRSLFTRIRYLLRSLYTVSELPTEDKPVPSPSTSPSFDTISINMEFLENNLFYNPTEQFDTDNHPADAYCFPFLRVLGVNLMSMKDFDTVPRLNLSSCSIAGHERELAYDCLDSFSSLINSAYSRTAISISCVFRLSILSVIPPELSLSIRRYFDDGHSEAIVQKIKSLFNSGLKVIGYEEHGSHTLSLHHCYSFSSIADMETPCEHCHVKGRQEIRQRLTILPPVLVIVLKRFDFNQHSPVMNYTSQQKITDYVDYPVEQLDLSPFVLNDAPAVYDLFAVCNHKGSSFFGHYYAYCRTYVNDVYQWMEFNDTVIRPIGLDEVVTSSAYLLFYHRRDLPLPYTSEQEIKNGIKMAIPEFGAIVEGSSLLRRSSAQFKEIIQGLNPLRNSSHHITEVTEPTQDSAGCSQEEQDHQLAISLDMEIAMKDQRKSSARYHTCLLTLVVIVIFLVLIIFFSILLYYHDYAF